MCCGHGRNALYLASRGCHVDAVDFSAQAIDWARERAQSAAVPVSFRCWDTAPFSVRVLRPMRKTASQEPRFGEDFLWALLATKADG